MTYHWQQQQWQNIQQQRSSGKLAHAILLAGSEGLGKHEFALQLAGAMLCHKVDAEGLACGQCAACHLLAAGTHPDLFIVQAEERGKAIKVDEIRQLSSQLSLTSQYGGYKVAVIVDAHDMNINAANSLLKTLEEPSSDALLLLVSSQPQKLPVTVRSRCQTIHFNVPDESSATEWLQQQGVEQPGKVLALAHGAPLLARELQQASLLEDHQTLVNSLLGVTRNQSLLVSAEQLHKLPQSSLLGWLYDWVQDLIKLHQCGESARLVHESYKADLLKLVSRSSLSGLYEFLEQLIKNRQLQSIPLNTQLLWEDLLLSWYRQIK